MFLTRVKKEIFALALGCLGFLPVQGCTHPHIWVETTLELMVKENQMIGFRVHWVFDALYSTSFLVEADTNKNKTLDAAETAATVKAVFVDGQKDLYPFMYMAPNSENTNFTLNNPNIGWKDESLTYSFDILFSQPKPLKGTHEFGIYDPEFYVAFEQDLDMILPSGISCTQTLLENPNISIYYGAVNPETYTLTCTE